MTLLTRASSASGSTVATTAFHGVRYLVTDTRRAVDFYTQNLGFTVEYEHHPEFATIALGSLKIHLSGPGSSGARDLRPGEPQRSGGSTRVVLRVRDLQSMIAEFRHQGMAFKNEMETGPGGRQIQLLDPDGNSIELFEPAQQQT